MQDNPLFPLKSKQQIDCRYIICTVFIRYKAILYFRASSDPRYFAFNYGLEKKFFFFFFLET